MRFRETRERAREVGIPPRSVRAALSAAHVGELVAELAPLVRDKRVRDVHPLPPRDLLLVLEGEGEGERPLRLRFSADPDGPRLHVQHARAPKPPSSFGPFYRRALAELVGARVTALAHVRGDRIARLDLRELAELGRGALVIELFGRHANLVLLGPSDRVVELLVPPPEGSSAPRLVLGSPWNPPPGRAHGDPGPTLVETFGEPPPESAADARVPGPSTRADGRAGGPSTRADGRPRSFDAPLSRLVEARLGGLVAAVADERARKQLGDRVRRKLARARSHAAGLARRRESVQQAERVRKDGELLMSSLHALSRGLREIVLPDLFEEDQRPRRIELDPKLGPRQNAERFFARYKKLVRTAETLAREERLASESVAALEELAARASDAGTDPEALEREAVEAGLLDPPQEAPKRRAPPAPRVPYHRFTGSAGSEIRVGRTASDNDALTFKHSRGNDLWLHTADAPGSHVVLRLERNAEPDPEELLDAAHLAVHFSPLRGAARANVHVARRKLVHKPRGAKPGLVTLSGGRTLALRVDRERLQRLLDPRRAAGGGHADERGSAAGPEPGDDRGLR